MFNSERFARRFKRTVAGRPIVFGWSAQVHAECPTTSGLPATFTYGWSSRRRQQWWAVILRLGIALLTGVCGASPAAADCAFTAGNSLGTATIALPAKLSVPRNASVGAVIYDSNWVVAGYTTVNCSGSNVLVFGYTNAMVPVPGFTNVYATGINGVGIKVAWVNSTTAPANIDSSPQFILWPQSTVNFSANSNYGPMGQIRVQLIVTGAISSGTLNLPAALAQAKYGSTLVNVLNLANNQAPIAGSACSRWGAAGAA